MKPEGIIPILAGLFSVVGAAKDWDWFMENRKARIWVKLFGRKGARIFFIILGGSLIVFGILFIMGIVN